MARCAYLEPFRSFELLGRCGVRKTIRMSPDPLQGLDTVILNAWRKAATAAYLNDSFL